MVSRWSNIMEKMFGDPEDTPRPIPHHLGTFGMSLRKSKKKFSKCIFRGLSQFFQSKCLQVVFKERQCVLKDKQCNIAKIDEIQRKIIVFEKGKIFEYSMLMLGLWAKNRNFSAQIKT